MTDQLSPEAIAYVRKWAAEGNEPRDIFDAGFEYSTLKTLVRYAGASRKECVLGPTGLTIATQSEEIAGFRKLHVVLGCFPGDTPDDFLVAAQELLDERRKFVIENMKLRAALKQANETAEECAGEILMKMDVPTEDIETMRANAKELLDE